MGKPAPSTPRVVANLSVMMSMKNPGRCKEMLLLINTYDVSLPGVGKPEGGRKAVSIFTEGGNEGRKQHTEDSARPSRTRPSAEPMA